MKTKILYIAIVALISSFLTSCEKHLLKPDPQNDPFTNFEYLWNEVNNKYSYFEYKGVNWDEAYDKYSQRIRDEMTDKELFNVLADLLYELRDGHVNLTSPFDRSRNWEWFINYPPNFNKNIVYPNYLGNDYRITGPLHNQVIDSVLYIYYESFASEIKQIHIEEITDRAKGLKGIIIDIRNNGGGAARNGTLLASVLTDVSYIYGYSRVKNGPGRDDFSPWRSLIINPGKGNKFTGQVVVLCNRASYSASNLFAQMMVLRSNTILMGDKSGGGGGIPAFGELPNGWLYRFSATQTINPEGEHIENGISPDIQADLTPEDEANGIDSIIEAALKTFK